MRRGCMMSCERSLLEEEGTSSPLRVTEAGGPFVDSRHLLLEALHLDIVSDYFV